MSDIGKKILALLAAIGTLIVLPALVFATPSSVNRITDHIEPLITTDYIKGSYFSATSTTASSTFANGLNITHGCFSVNGTCLSSGGSGTVTSVTASTPNSTLSLGGTNPITTSGTISFDLNLGHSNTWTALQNSAAAGTTTISNGLEVGGKIASPYFMATSTTASSTFAAPIISTASYNKFGASTCGNGTLLGFGDGLELCGSRNSDTAAVQIQTSNTNSGTAAWNGFTMSNNLGDSTQTHFFGLYLNSSGYTSTTFGTALAKANAGIIQNTDGPLLILDSTSSASTANAYIGFYMNGSNTGNEVMRLLQSSRIAIGTTTTQFGALTIATSTGPQLMLADNSLTTNQWAMRSIGGLFFLATSTATATSSASAFSINANGFPIFPSLGTGAVSAASGVLSAGTLALSNGGTNASLSGASQIIAMNSGNTALTTNSGYTLTSSLLTAPNASTTNLTAGTFAALPTGSTCANFALGSFCLDTTDNQLQIGTSTSVVPAVYSSYSKASFTAATTTWSGTTTANQLIVPEAGTIKDSICKTDAGTLNVQVKVNSTNLTMFNASTTGGTISWTSSTALVRGDILEYDFGTPASSPTIIRCTTRVLLNAT